MITRRRVFATVLLLCLSASALAQRRTAPRRAPAPRPPSAEAAAPSGDEQAIVDLENHLLAYIRDKSAKEVEPWIADDFQYIDTRGNALTRTQYLDRVKSVRGTITSLLADDMRVRVFGNVAVVTGVKHSESTEGDPEVIAGPNSPPPTRRSLAFTDVFRRRGSDWEWVQEFAADTSQDGAAGAATSAPEQAKPAGEGGATPGDEPPQMRKAPAEGSHPANPQPPAEGGQTPAPRPPSTANSPGAR